MEKLSNCWIFLGLFSCGKKHTQNVFSHGKSGKRQYLAPLLQTTCYKTICLKSPSRSNCDGTVGNFFILKIPRLFSSLQWKMFNKKTSGTNDINQVFAKSKLAITMLIIKLTLYRESRHHLPLKLPSDVLVAKSSTSHHLTVA